MNEVWVSRKNAFQYMKKTLYLNVVTEPEGKCRKQSNTEKNPKNQ